MSTNGRLQDAHLKQQIKDIYGDDSERQLSRYESILEKFHRNFKEGSGSFFSSPGRVEVGGNHTDHNGGKVLAGSINLDTVAFARPAENNRVLVECDGFTEPFIVDLRDLEVKSGEQGTTALLRGVLAGFKSRGFKIGGFEAYISSEVGIGSGLSSSASVEMLLGTILNTFYNDGKVPVAEMAKIGQFAENTYWKKPSGLLDQMACGTGGLVLLNFKDRNNPSVTKVEVDVTKLPYSFLFVDTGGSHANLTELYASIPQEMWGVAKACGAERLADTGRSHVLVNLPQIRRDLGDRAVLRALHFYSENERVEEEVSALQKGEHAKFLQLVNESGSSSWRLLQNCYDPRHETKQRMTLALSMAETFIKIKGLEAACRVHGGGFAGMILVIIPKSHAKEFASYMGPVYGGGACFPLRIRSHGSVCLS